MNEEEIREWMHITRPCGEKEKSMVLIRKSGMTPKERAELENAQASAQKNADLIEYLAMMTDVDIPTDEEDMSNE